MSFILDALKKSDSERQRQAGPALFEIRSARPRAGRLPGWAFVLGALLLVNLVALGWFLTRSPAPAATPLPPPPAATGAALPTATATLRAPAPRPAPVLPPQRSGAPALPASETTNPADLEPALPAGSTQAPRDAAEVQVDRSIAPTLEQLPASVTSQLPTLHLDLHVYATRAADRFVLVNMQRLREGDATREGVRVEAITPTGVVLDFRGTRFQLERE
ncbi:MAG: general secretion pathway protein GspB [Steroidobacteraceae bacterium]